MKTQLLALHHLSKTLFNLASARYLPIICSEGGLSGTSTGII